MGCYLVMNTDILLSSTSAYNYCTKILHNMCIMFSLDSTLFLYFVRNFSTSNVVSSVAFGTSTYRLDALSCLPLKILKRLFSSLAFTVCGIPDCICIVGFARVLPRGIYHTPMTVTKLPAFVRVEVQFCQRYGAIADIAK